MVTKAILIACFIFGFESYANSRAIAQESSGHPEYLNFPPSSERQPNCFANLQPVEVSGVKMVWPYAEPGYKTDSLGLGLSLDPKTGDCMPYDKASELIGDSSWLNVYQVSVDLKSRRPDGYQGAVDTVRSGLEFDQNYPGRSVKEMHGFHASFTATDKSERILNFYRIDPSYAYSGHCHEPRVKNGLNTHWCSVYRHSPEMPEFLDFHFDMRDFDQIQKRLQFTDALIKNWYR
jgi:hypothetical protein